MSRVSDIVSSQFPAFMRESCRTPGQDKDDGGALVNFIKYYYESQEKTGTSGDILGSLMNYLDVDKVNVDILEGSTTAIEPIGANDTEITVESIDKFLEGSGTISIGDEVITYESTTNSPNISLSSGIAYNQVKLKWIILANVIDLFDGVRTRFPLVSQEKPISPPSTRHLIVKVYGRTLIPDVDYSIDGSDIIFVEAPRTRIPADDETSTSLIYLDGFTEDTIRLVDDITSSFDSTKKCFKTRLDGETYEPICAEYLIVIYDNRLLTPKVDYFLNNDELIFEDIPATGRSCYIGSIEAPLPSFGGGGVGYAKVNDDGELIGINVSDSGLGYRFAYPPNISIISDNGSCAAAQALVNGIKEPTLLNGGIGFSDTNPPIVQVEPPTQAGAQPAIITATVTDGSVSGLELVSSGSGYTFTPRITFKQPGGAHCPALTIANGSVVGTTLTVEHGGEGYTTAPEVYVDEPTGENGIKASLRANIENGSVVSITVLNPGQGYETTPRCAIVDPTGAQVLDVSVDGAGRVIGIELLTGGSGYTDIPSVYIVDPNGNGSGATAVASIFNGRITDINVTDFGSGYDAENPPTVTIQSPATAEAACSIGLNEVTGFKVDKQGEGYSKAQFLGCARGASGVTSFTEDGNARFSNETTSSAHDANAEIKCLDSLFLEQLLDKYKAQYLPNVPELDFSKINLRTAFKTIRDFYSAKGTSFSISYLFKLLYAETISISYPKDQLIKPSAATWSIDTILRATLVSGDPANIRDAQIQQEEDIADPNVRAANALVENYISINTSTETIYELVLSEETINGKFVVPYKTKLAEPIGREDSIITVDSTIGWPERNGEFVIGNEVVQYKEKSLNQFIECTRAVNNISEDWDSATEVTSNFKVYLNKDTAEEVVMNVLGIVDAQQTTLTDTGSYYLPGDKLTVSKLGGTEDTPQLSTWLYNVKKLVEVSSITFGGINNQSATVTCNNNHGLLVGDQVTIYGANPIIYNGTFTVTSRDSETVFQYQLPQPAVTVPQGTILVSVDLNKGKSESSAITNAIGPYTTNIQNSFFNDEHVYVASTGIPNYSIGPFTGLSLLPGNQRKLNRFSRNPVTISTKNKIVPGPIGTFINGVSIWSYISSQSKTFGSITSINTVNPGIGYDAANPPVLTISGGGGSGAEASVVVNGAVSEIEVTAGGTGYTSSPLVSIVGGGGSGASATAIITKGKVSRILITDGGSGYTTQPSITIVGGEGSGAAATASIRGPIQKVNIDEAGSGYTSNPEITLSSGSGAVAQPIVSDGRIISIAIIAAGSGYTTAPEVIISGDGFGAVAKANIDTDGENAGKVTSITIQNRGVGYTQGSTQILLESIGSLATFNANVFQWTYNLQETTTVDSAKGGVFTGFNNQYGGEYAHISNPQRLRYILGDNLNENTDGSLEERQDSLQHSPIIGWAFDGNPIYGPYAYSDPTDQSSEISRMRSSYSLKKNLTASVDTPFIPEGQTADDAITVPYRIAGPTLSDEPAGKFIDDYEYVFDSGDLDRYNGRFCKTPEYPNGRYCYFTTIDATEDGNPVFPYLLGPSYNSVVDSWNLSAQAVQQNIPTGVVRYRDPYENVDIDVERVPNESTNALTAENGDILLFEIEDENRDGVISSSEQSDPDQILEESPLQLFDYFPKVEFDSKVDIEVETITRFEDASVTGFTIENAGKNYQVNDRLVFDNDDTDGSGVSARISRIKGEDIESFSFESISGQSFGVLTTEEPHNLVVGDRVYVDYSPIMDNTNKRFIVRQYKGIEKIEVTQTGSGYNEDIPPTITIDGDGIDGKLEAVVTSVGSIDTVNIINSGSGYTKNPRAILSHPQVFKKADYFASLVDNNDYVKINDIFVNADKESFICGVTKNSSDKEVAFIAKLSSTGVKSWQKSIESTAGLQNARFEKIFVDGDDIWVIGQNEPNSTNLNTYNPDIILVKYTQSENGLDASVTYKKAYAGISGSTRSDNITDIKKYTDTRTVISGYTNTNSSNPYDAFLAVLDTTGNFSIKRKIASNNQSEKITNIIVSGSNIYFVMEVAANTTDTNVDVAIGKATIKTNSIDINWIKRVSNNLYSFIDTGLAIDEFNELYVTATLRSKSTTTTKDSFWVGKYDVDGDAIWNKRYALSETDINMIGKATIDIFNDLNIAFNVTNTTSNLKTVETVKIKYDGSVINQTRNQVSSNQIEGFTAHSIESDNSGDVYLTGQSLWNRNEFLLQFTGTDDFSDSTSHYTPTAIGNGATDSLDVVGDGIVKFFGRDIATPANWDNAAIKFPSAQLGTKLDGNWTIEFMIYKDSANTDTHSQTEQTLLAIGDATDATGGLWLYYDVSGAGGIGSLTLVIANNTTTINAASGALSSPLTNMYADDTWQFVALTKSGNVFTMYVNGISVGTGTVANTSLGNKDLHFGNIPGRDGTAGTFRSNEQGQYYMDNLRMKNRTVTPTVPSDVSSLPLEDAYALAFDWTDDDWFTDYVVRYDYIDYHGMTLKVDKNADSDRLGATSELTNTEIIITRTAQTASTSTSLTLTNPAFTLGAVGLQTLDYDDSTVVLTDNSVTPTYSQDVWSSRTATVPSPGSQKLIITPVVKDRYFFKVTDTAKIDNIQRLTLNQSANLTVGAQLTLNTASGTFINSGYIISVDTENNYVYTAVNNNTWTNDLNTGLLKTEKFDRQDTLGITGATPNDINIIEKFNFTNVINTTPGTFDIDMEDYDLDGAGLETRGRFKAFSDDDYSIRIDEVSGSSSYIVGSLVSVPRETDVNDPDFGDPLITFNSERSTVQITGLTGVTKITLISTLDKIIQVTAVANSDEVYVISTTRHYLDQADIIFIDGNGTNSEYDGAFPVHSVVSPLEFTYKLDAVATTDPAATASNVSIYAKSPTLKMYYGHQYLFDLSHGSMLGSNLSFSKDNLYKLEYSFNSIQRVGTPGVTGEGEPSPTVKLKVDENIVTNISYYFDPSRTGEDSPVIEGSYLDVVKSPYIGNFEISGVAGATITRGADTIKFPLLNEPEGDAEITRASYSTDSVKAVGSISDIRIVNSGGFYTRLPIVTGIESSRQIERVQINAPGTEYVVGTYDNVKIKGDGEGGLVTITVANGTDDEGILIPGQIQSVVVTAPGKNYTTATIDLEELGETILGPGLTGSGAELEVVIPSAGSDASIFTKGDKVGKIKNLKNNNFGYDYPHDYTLRPEITFPINAQLTSTSILSSITVTDPGSGYSQPPAVVVTGGGGSGAIAEATIKNGRIDNIIVKDAGSGYSSTPAIELKSSFNYVINVDLGLLQFAFPHGIQNGAEVTLNVVDTGEPGGVAFPLASGALGRLNGTTTYYAIAGTANSLEDDQLKLAITASNAELGDAISFVNPGSGRQQVLTSSFGGAAEANVVTSTFLEGELVYQGDSLETATATGYVSTNNGWQVGPRIVKIVDYTGEFASGQKITGVVSKSSGVISDLKIAKGVLEIGSITKTTGQFIDDVGKPSEIIQKIQDSYYYQDFSYAIRSSVPIEEWKQILLKNVHPVSFKVFGELNIEENATIPNKQTYFQFVKSVELAQKAIIPNIQSFALAEPIYSEFNNTEVLFRQKRLTSSENILTSVVQRLDDISNLFDGERTSFPLRVNQENVVANANQLTIVLNGVVQNPGTAFTVQNDSIVFDEPPQPPASVRYIDTTISQIDIVQTEYTNISGIFPNIGNDVVGIVSGARLRVTSVVGNSIFGYMVGDETFIFGEQTTVGATGFSGNIQSSTAIENNGLFRFGEQVTNFSGDTAKVESINLETGVDDPIAKLRYTIGAGATSIEVIDYSATQDSPVAEGTFETGKNYQIGSELITVTAISTGGQSTTLTATRGVGGTQAVDQQEDAPVYGTEIEVTNQITLSKTVGTYQSKPGLFNINTGDVIIGAQSGVVASVTFTSVYQDPTTQESIGQVEISSGSTFFGLLFNRIASTTYPNVVLDDISKSQVSVVEFQDNETAFNLKFPANEQINNYILPYDNLNGTFQEDEIVRNLKIDYGNTSGDFATNETARVFKVSYTDYVGSGFFSRGQIIRTEDTKAEVLGFNQARKIIYVGKMGRCKSTGEDYHTITFNGDAELDTAIKKYNDSSLKVAGSGYLSIPSSSEFAFGTSDFTIDLWVRFLPAAGTGTVDILDMRSLGTDPNAGRLYANNAQLRWNVNGTDVVTSGATVVTTEQWKHVAVVRESSTTKIYLDGVEVGSASDSTTYNAKPIRIGADYSGSSGFTGNIDEVRISTTSRYDAAFSPSSGIHQGDADTKLLLHLEGDDQQTYTDDWSGAESFTADEDFNNDSILETSRKTGAPAGFAGKTHRYYDAANRIFDNKEFIAKEVVYLMKQKFPYFTVPGGQINCEDDIRDILDELIEDIRNGGNNHMWDAAALYVDRTANPIELSHVETEITETIWAYQKVKEILQYVITNDIWDPQGDHGLRQVTDSTISYDLGSTPTTLSATGATYDPATGLMVITSNNHGLVGPQTHTVTAADYIPSTGIMTLTIANHGLSNGDKIQIDEAALTFTCAMDGNTAQKTYPRSNDPGALGWLKVSNVTTNTFDVNVGISADDYYTVTAVDYDPANNKAVLTIGDHELRPGTSIRLQNESLTFTCATDNNESEHSYPRSGDGNYETAINIVNNGSSHTPTGAIYNAQSGVMTLTLADHGFVVGDKVRVEDNSLTFTCSQDNHATQHTYPRATDPVSGRWLRITAVTTDTFTVNVGNAGTASNYTHTFVSASTDAITRRNGTITINLPSTTDTSDHTFVRDELIGGNGAVRAGGNYTHTFVSAVADSITSQGNAVYLADGSFRFTCTSDGNDRELSHPRPSDTKVYRQVLPLTAHTTNTFTLDVGASDEFSQFAHTYVDSDANAITVSNYTTADCADVYSTVSNLTEILIDTLEQANLPVPVDHLNSVTKVTPEYEFGGATVSQTANASFIVNDFNSTDTLIHTHQIDGDDRYRFYDAANLLRLNTSVIIDKTSADLIAQYPDLALDMPRNQDGSGDGTARCKVDLTLIIAELIKDIEQGGNLNTVQSARFYLNNENEILHIRRQLPFSLYAHDRLGYYMKQAITGDLTYDNTDDIIIGDWGITNDPGGCANVQTAIDNLIDTLNDQLAPKGADARTAADRLYFNRFYIAEEITGKLTSQSSVKGEFVYTLTDTGGTATDYVAFQYPGSDGESKCQRDMREIIVSAISDLQTGGNNSTIDAIKLYLNSDNTLNHVEDQLLPTVYAIEQLKELGEKAIRNYLRTQGSTGLGSEYYIANHTSISAYTDELTLTDEDAMVYAWRDLIDLSVDILAPGGLAARYAGKQILFNENYYKTELETDVNAQFGAGSWSYNTFVEDVVSSVTHDMVITNFKDKQNAYKVEVDCTVGSVFEKDEVFSWTVSSVTYYGRILEVENFEDSTVGATVQPAYIYFNQASTGSIVLPSASDTLTTVTDPAKTATVRVNPGSSFTWYNAPANIETRSLAAAETTTVETEIARTNLFVNPENFSSGWTSTETTVAAETTVFGPDNSQNVYKLTPSTNSAVHKLHRNFNLTAFTTFDSGSTTFDSGTVTFDEGAVNNQQSQQFTASIFVKAAGLTTVRFGIILDESSAAQPIQFDANLSTGTVGSLFIPQGGITGDDYGITPYGNGWFRLHLTCSFAFGFSQLRVRLFPGGDGTYAGNGTNGIYVFGAKLVKGAVDPYVAESGVTFFVNREYNIKTYILDKLRTYFTQVLDGSLQSPSPLTDFIRYYDSTNASEYNKESISRLIRYYIEIIEEQLKNSSYYTSVIPKTGISVPVKVYGDRDAITGVPGNVGPSEYFYGLLSDHSAELESIRENEGVVVKVYTRLRIDGDITDGPYVMNENVQKQGDATVTGVVYGFHEDANYKYLDVDITGGTWQVTDVILGATNGTTATVGALETRLHIIDLVGNFENDIPFKGYTSGATATPTNFLKNQAAVIDNTGGVLEVDTDTLLGTFEKNSVVYAESSRKFIDVKKFGFGLDLQVGAKIASSGYIRLGVSVLSGLNSFTEGNTIYKVTGGAQDLNNYGIITEVDLDNNYVYIAPIVGTIAQGDLVGDYGLTNENFPVGYASVSTKLTVAGAAGGFVQDIQDVGQNKRIYLNDVYGTFTERDYIISTNNYKAAILDIVDIKGRVGRSSKGFDGTTTTFNLTTGNGTAYFPDPEGHMLIFINGILQPPGASNAYTAFSNQIQFSEPPDSGASFTGFYVGKLRQLDDIGFEFDSLRQSFNLKRNDVFYSLTLTEGVQSSVIRPENNIIVSINGVLQEPGVGFEIVGSRIIFTEIPRVGSTFVAFSYVGSEADVDATEVVPPVEVGDLLEIQGETEEREVAVIESSNSLITFDYIGSVFGQNASATANLTTGSISKVNVTAGGSGYTSKPVIRIDSTTGFEGNITPLVGVAGVEISNPGSGYQNPTVEVETSVPDDWTAPNLADYGEELVDPETL